MATATAWGSVIAGEEHVAANHGAADVGSSTQAALELLESAQRIACRGSAQHQNGQGCRPDNLVVVFNVGDLQPQVPRRIAQSTCNTDGFDHVHCVHLHFVAGGCLPLLAAARGIQADYIYCTR